MPSRLFFQQRTQPRKDRNRSISLFLVFSSSSYGWLRSHGIACEGISFPFQNLCPATAGRWPHRSAFPCIQIVPPRSHSLLGVLYQLLLFSGRLLSLCYWHFLRKRCRPHRVSCTVHIVAPVGKHAAYHRPCIQSGLFGFSFCAQMIQIVTDSLRIDVSINSSPKNIFVGFRCLR